MVPLLDHAEIVVSAMPKPRHISLLFSFLALKMESIRSTIAFIFVFSEKKTKKYANVKNFIDKYARAYYIIRVIRKCVYKNPLRVRPPENADGCGERLNDFACSVSAARDGLLFWRKR